MTTRVLPAEEWGKVYGSALLDMLPPKDATVVVVEDGGEILASVAVLRVTHFEGLEIKQRNAGVIRALLTAAYEEAGKHGNWAIAGAADDRMRAQVEDFGAVRIPMDSYALRVK